MIAVSCSLDHLFELRVQTYPLRIYVNSQATLLSSCAVCIDVTVILNQVSIRSNCT
jgi:hypothetical protein